jgi:hypothetical protein
MGLQDCYCELLILKDRLFCARAVPIISVTLAGRRAISGPMRATDAAAGYRRRSPLGDSVG